MTTKESVRNAEGSLRTAEQVLKQCSQEVGVDLEPARGHLRNARNELEGRNFVAAVRNIQRAKEAAGAVIRDRIQQSVESFRSLVCEAEEEQPHSGREELQAIRKNLLDTSELLGRLDTAEVFDWCNDLQSGLESLRNRLRRWQVAFRPPSAKDVPQRGRARASKKSGRGPGRHRRKR